MSPDNFVQDPQNSQNFNRYAYCYNNPLMYTDPSGELWELSVVASAAIIGALISGTVYTGMALYYGDFTWEGLLKSVGIGAVSGAITSGIGSLSRSMLVSAGNGIGAQIGVAAFQMSMHGISQMFIAGISGGDVGQAFWSGMVSSVVSSGVMGLNSAINLKGTAGDISTMLFGTVSGGLSSKLTGGKFWEGAAIGLTVSGLNHVAHKLAPDNGWERDGKGGYKKVNDLGGDEIDYLYENGQIVESTSVKTVRKHSEFPLHDGYGVRYENLGAGLIDPTGDIVYGIFGGGLALKGLGLAWKGFAAYTGFPKQWFRLGSSYSHSLGSKTYLSLRWGAGGNHWQKIGSPTLQSWNKVFRTTKLPINSWRAADPGHFHIFPKSPFKF